MAKAKITPTVPGPVDPVATATAGDGVVAHVARAERAARGKAARKRAPLEAQAMFVAGADRTDPVDLLVQQGQSRVPELVPIRHGRMLVSPFTYYRGAALPMAADLATTPDAGLRVQLCGDAHLSNFGMYGSPERRLVFDLNDFDETSTGPFEWDVKRLAASLEVAGRDNGYTAKERHKIALAAGRDYRTAMRGFADLPLVEVWYANLDVDQFLADFGGQMQKYQVKRTKQMIAKARTQDNLKALTKLTTTVDGRRRIISDPPLIVPVAELFADMEADAITEAMTLLLRAYRRSLESDRRHLIEQFKLTDVARKVVGVGSVGTRAYVLLLDPDDGQEPLFLQAKEAEASVLEAYCGRSPYANHGERVIAGQRLMQAASDIFLGWERVTGVDRVKRDFYVRQLRDWKFSFPVDQARPTGMQVYARMCAWTLARAHARSGDRISIAAYLGGSDAWDQAIADFAVAYADQNEKDHAALATAIRTGRLVAETGL
jgi:uncharacterized protein (DUF2252 family)